MPVVLSRVRLNNAGLTAILRGTEGRLGRDLDARGARVAARAGRGYTSEGWTGRRRYRVNVASDRPVIVAASPLLRSVDAARGSGS